MYALVITTRVVVGHINHSHYHMQVCHGPDTCGDMAAVGLYAVALVNTTFVNTPPVITSPANVTVWEDIADFIVTLTAVDAEDDKFVFTVTNKTTPRAKVFLSPDGKLTYASFPDYYGHDVISYAVTEVRTDGNTPLSASGQLLVILLPVNDPPVLQLFEYGKNIIPPSNVVNVDAPVNSLDTNYTQLEFLLAVYDVERNFVGEITSDLKLKFQPPQHGSIFFYPSQIPWGMLKQNCTWPWELRRKPWDNLIDGILSPGTDASFIMPNPCGSHLIDMGVEWKTTILKYKPAENFIGTDVIEVCM